MNALQKKIHEVYTKEFLQPTQAILPEIKALFKPEYENYTEGSCSCNRAKYFEKNRITDVIHIISRTFPEIDKKPQKILDLGCGFGEFSAVFRGFGHDVTSVNGGETWYLDDFNHTTNKLNLKVDLCDLLKGLPYPNKHFDTVFASEILTLDTLLAHSNSILEELFRVANRVIVLNHKKKYLNYDTSRFSPEIHVAAKDHLNIVTFFAGEKYKTLAENLIVSGKNFGYHVHAFHMNNPHNWGKAVCEKPRLIYKYYTKLGPPLLYIDADCLIMKPLFDLADIIRSNPLTIRERNLECRFNAGIMGFGTHYLMAPLLKRWYMLTKERLGASHTVDQKPLEIMLSVEPYKSKIKVFDLPIKYNFLPADVLEHNKDDAVILHLKESKDNALARKWRNQILGGDG